MNTQLFLVFALVGFADVGLGRSYQETSCEEGRKAFTETIHPVLRKNCIPCHDTGGKAPPHSAGDSKAAYEVALRYIAFDRLDQAAIVDHGGDFHCRDYGGSATCGTDKPTLKRAAEQWWSAGQNKCPGSMPKFVTSAVTIPATLPSSRNKEALPLRWSLAALHPSLKEVSFELEVQQMAASNGSRLDAYVFRRPRLASANAPVFVKGLTFILNGRPAGDLTAFRMIEQTVAPHSFNVASAMWPFPMLASGSMLILANPPLGKDVLSIGFDELQVRPGSRSCQAMDQFPEKVSPFWNIRCASCHGPLGGPSDPNPTDPQAVARLPLGESMDDSCRTLRPYVDMNDWTKSIMVGLALGRELYHVRRSPSISDFEVGVSDWMQAEAGTK